jgi:Tol biopolymer transport system component
MKNIFKGSIVLIIFSFSIIIFNISCKKESIAQTNTPYVLPKATSSSLGGVIVGSGLSVTTDGTISTQPLGILIFYKTSEDGLNQFWTSNYDGTNQKKISISSMPSDESIAYDAISFSPDGKKIFFNAYKQNGTGRSTYSCNADGTGLVKLFDGTYLVRVQ